MVYRLSQEDRQSISEEGFIGKLNKVVWFPTDVVIKGVSKIFLGKSSGYNQEVTFPKACFYVGYEGKAYQWADPEKVKQKGYLEKRIMDILESFKKDYDKPVTIKMDPTPQLLEGTIKASIGSAEEWGKIRENVGDLEGLLGTTMFRHISNLLKTNIGSEQGKINARIVATLIYVFIPKLSHGVKNGSIEDYGIEDDYVNHENSLEINNHIEEGELEDTEQVTANDALSANIDENIDKKMEALAESEHTLNNTSADIDKATSALESLEYLIDSLKLIQENGGFDKPSLEMYHLCRNSIYKNAGLAPGSKLSLESFDDYSRASITKIAIEEEEQAKQGFFKRILEFIKNLFKNIWNWFKGFFSLNQAIRNKAEKIKKVLAKHKNDIEIKYNFSDKDKEKYGRLMMIDGTYTSASTIASSIEAGINQLRHAKVADRLTECAKKTEEHISSLEQMHNEFVNIYMGFFAKIFVPDAKIKEHWDQGEGEYATLPFEMPGNYVYALCFKRDKEGKIISMKKGIVQLPFKNTPTLTEDRLPSSVQEILAIVDNTIKGCDAETAMIKDFDSKSKEMARINDILIRRYAGTMGFEMINKRVEKTFEVFYQFKFLYEIFVDIATKIPRISMKALRGVLDIILKSISIKQGADVKQEDIEVLKPHQATKDDVDNLVNPSLVLPSPA